MNTGINAAYWLVYTISNSRDEGQLILLNNLDISQSTVM